MDLSFVYRFDHYPTLYPSPQGGGKAFTSSQSFRVFSCVQDTIRVITKQGVSMMWRFGRAYALFLSFAHGWSCHA